MFSTTRRSCDKPARRWVSGATTQAMPRGAYYDILITSPPPYSNHTANEPPVTARRGAAEETAKPTTTKETETNTKKSFQPSEAPAVVHAAKMAAEKATAAASRQANKDAAEARARIVFGSRLAGPMERENRLAELRKRSKRVAGVLVPPKPTEPDNCCMSGCVNCVWDRFRDDMEAWAMANAEVQRRLGRGAATAATTPAVSMDDDGGGSDSNWSSETVAMPTTTTTPTTSGWEEDMFKDVPVGIREFMKQEKRLKLKHMQEGSLGG